MSADYKVQRLYDEYIKDIVSDSDKWKKFLELTGRVYRYEFDNILMMYAQRPNATLVGDYDSWKKVGRYVKRGRDRKSTRLNSSHTDSSRMPSSA